MDEVWELHGALLESCPHLLLCDLLWLHACDGEGVGAIVALDGGDDLARFGSYNLADEGWFEAGTLYAVEFVGDGG